tara:strand:- start:197 stop:766 length:570 start_codon:yes stop_codon:yes gene_type:complete
MRLTHRGIVPFSTSDYTEPQRTFSTVANKTYHLRWNPTDGFSLKDVADGAYNPISVAEQTSIFDTSYDDMLISRVVTNSSNVCTITNLINKDRYRTSYEKLTKETSSDGLLNFDNPALLRLVADLDLARTPEAYVVGAVGEVTGGYDSLTHIFANADRYSLEAGALGYGQIFQSTGLYQSGTVKVSVSM